MQREGKSLFSVAFRLSVALFLPSSRHESDFNHTRARGALVVPSSFGFMEVRSLGTQKPLPLPVPAAPTPLQNQLTQKVRSPPRPPTPLSVFPRVPPPHPLPAKRKTNNDDTSKDTLSPGDLC